MGLLLASTDIRFHMVAVRNGVMFSHYHFRPLRTSFDIADGTARGAVLPDHAQPRQRPNPALLGRTEPHLMLDHLRESDAIVVWKLDRLSRSLKDVLHRQRRGQPRWADASRSPYSGFSTTLSH
jgi:Resolvase, N terminal domain